MKDGTYCLADVELMHRTIDELVSDRIAQLQQRP